MRAKTAGTEFFGMNQFSRRVGLSPPTVRMRIAAGIITPLRADDTGWSLFCEEHVAALRDYEAQQRKAKKRTG